MQINPFWIKKKTLIKIIALGFESGIDLIFKIYTKLDSFMQKYFCYIAMYGSPIFVKASPLLNAVWPGSPPVEASSPQGWDP